MIKHNLFLFLLFTINAGGIIAQNHSIQGKITDSAQTPLIGVSVAVEGSAIGTVTDMDGLFSLNVPNTESVLSVSYIGFKTQKIKVGQQTGFTIVMTEDSEILDELVVVGYGVVKKKDLTGSTVSVGSGVVKDKPVANIAEALQGRAAGVMITNSGAPGSNSSIRIRGLGSINDASPLIVIDGVPTDLNLNAINQNDVETIDVLKDASATAIYGSRGANGVIIISTKKGKDGQGILSFSANTAINQAIGVPHIMNARQFASLHNEMMLNGGQPQRPDFADPTLWNEGTGWYNELIQTGQMQNYLLSYSGGGANNNYYVSAGIFDQKGIVIATDFKRYTLQFNNEAKVRPWLKFGNNLTFSHDAKRNGAYDVLNTLKSLPTQPVLDSDGNYSGPGASAVWYGDLRNPIGTARLEKNETQGYNLLGNIFGEINILQKVYLKSLAGLDYKDWNGVSFSPQYDWKPIPVPYSKRSESWNKAITYLWDNTITYMDTFAGRHNINVMLGSSAQNNEYRYMNGSKEDFLSDDYNQLNNGLLNPLIGGGQSAWALLSFFGRANYNYDNRYLLTATLRRDGTSRISPQNRWGTFPSFSAAWRFVEDGKLRIGYGETGNQAPLDTYAYITRLKTAQYVFNDQPIATLYPLVMPSPGIKWETVKQWNIGIDASLFKQKINLTFDAYIKNTSDMLVGMAVPITTGYSDSYTPQINVGQVQNRGCELTVSSRNIMHKNFEWTTDANVSFNKNKVVKLDGDVPMYFGVQTHTVGKPIGAFYGYVTDGIFQNWDEVNSHAVQKPATEGGQGTSPGDIRFKDLDNNGVINDNDRTFLGDPTPSWIFSMNNSFNFYHFDLQIYLQGVAGNEIYNGTRATLESMSTVTNQSIKMLDRWRGEGTSNTIPRAVYADPNNNNRTSGRFIEDGSYLRLKNVTLGYTLPEKPLAKILLSSARVFVSAQNLLTLTRYSGFDPEASGLDLGSYPMTRTVSFGLDIKF
ncbi:MAG: TonB-dependent receptor [Dysgonamonadaceae bacterium]|jgi:TonB-linked SusC/RagA family outer membrane protein|nr:TonB-dependent receptor [Dysgonamonadaceae bacterium]